MKIQLILKLQSLKMTAQEERAYRSYFWEQCSLGVYIWTQPSYQVSVYIWTQLTEGPCSGCLHLDPAQLQYHHPPAPKNIALKSKH